MHQLRDSELNGVMDVDVIAGNQQLILSRHMIANVGVADSRLFFGLYEPEYCLRIRGQDFGCLVDGEMMRAQTRNCGPSRIGPTTRNHSRLPSMANLAAILSHTELYLHDAAYL